MIAEAPAAHVAAVRQAHAPASVAELVLGLRAGRMDPVDVLDEHLDRVAAGRDLNAFLWADRERLLADARRRPARGLPLAGLPIALKDNIDTAGIPTTAGSIVDRDRVPVVDAAAWRRLRDEGGANLLGKTHMSEFAYRSHHPDLGWVRNPRQPGRATGGSSSGSAAAVGAGIAPAALGTDTGGSIRIPAAYCGVVGLKGTFGRIENDGLVPLSTTMDHIGVLARSVRDAAIVFERTVAEPLRLVDPDSLEVPPLEPGGLRVGLERGYFLRGAQPGVARSWSRAAGKLAAAGCRLVDVDLPRAQQWRAAHKRIIRREAWDYHADRVRAGAPYGPVFRASLEDGARISDRTYAAALRTRRAAIDELAALFGGGVDVLLTPTCPTVAPPLDEGRGGVAYTRYTTMAAFAGLPAVSVPAGTGHLRLPVGVQLIAAAGEDTLLVAAAALLERLLGADRDEPA